MGRDRAVAAPAVPEPGGGIRSLRPPKDAVDPWRAVATLNEPERSPNGGAVPSFTIFLAGAECPFTCVYCDLWRYTLDGATPQGALPRQIEDALRTLDRPREETTLKLYNASNFFDDRAVPRQDWTDIAALVRGFPRVVVECHPRLVGEACFEFAELIDGRLEVAMGLETADPEALSRLDKKMVVEDFERSAATLRARGLGVRAFVLVGAPFLPKGTAVEWAVRSVDVAIAAGSEVVSLIAVRAGNGYMDRLRDSGAWSSPGLGDLEASLEGALAVAGEPPGPVVLADLWEVGQLGCCGDCRRERVARMERANLSGRIGPPVRCDACTPVEDLL